MQYSDLFVKDRNKNNGEIKEIIKVSKLCFGSLCIGPLQSDLGINDGADIIKQAFDLGINFIDTAQLYGTYKYIKSALEKYYSDNNINNINNINSKNNIVVSTKTYAYTKKLAKEALDEALRELNRDYIDIFMLHEQESIHTIYGHIGALEYLFDQKEAGKIKAVGISTHHISGVSGAVEFNETYKKNKLDLIHPMYNISGLGIIPDSDIDSEPDKFDKIDKIKILEHMETALLKAKKSGFFIFSMKAIGGGNLFSQAENALNFVLNKPFIDSVAVGMKSLPEVHANVKLFETGKFPDEYYADYQNYQADQLKQPKKRLHIDDWCSGCGKCVSKCSAGALRISDGRAVCDYNKCVLCGYCSSVCRDFAIKII